MFTEDKIAAAQMAQIFGSELLKVQQNSKTDSDSVPDIVRLDPKQFLINNTQHTHRPKLMEQQMLESLQREAEAACPLPESKPLDSVSLQTTPSNETKPADQPSANVLRQSQSTIIRTNIDTILERIALSLEKIAAATEKIKTPKKKSLRKKTIKIGDNGINT